METGFHRRCAAVLALPWTRWRAAAATEVVTAAGTEAMRAIGARSILARRSLVERLWRRPLLAIDPCRMDLDLQLTTSGELGTCPASRLS